MISNDLDKYYRIPADFRDLNYSKYVEKGVVGITEINDYNSHNTKLLNVDEMKNLLLETTFIQKIMNQEHF